MIVPPSGVPLVIENVNGAAFMACSTARNFWRSVGPVRDATGPERRGSGSSNSTAGVHPAARASAASAGTPPARSRYQPV